MCSAEPGAGRQRLKVVLEELTAGWVLLRIRAVPTGLPQQSFRSLVDVIGPGREHAHVRPLPHRVSSAVARFQHDRLQAAFESMRCRG